MTIWIAILLGLVQGLTEFLPVSSSGHLILFQHFLGIDGDMMLFNIILHIATLTAVVVVFRKKIWSLVKQPFCKTNLALLLATVITCAMVFVFKDLIDRSFTHRILPITFLITATLLFATTLLAKGAREVGYKTSALAGFIQGIAVIPGISRSGSTIAACLSTGTKREAAAEFSFLMSIPIIVASFVYELISGGGVVLNVSPIALICAFVAALVSGVLAIKIMLRVVKNVKLYWFSMYLVILAIVLLFAF
jgi:undecaprenyl-diphosphatase